jgi:outer membrane protein TolC
MVPRIQVSQAEVQVKNMEPELVTSENQIKMAKASFAQSLGLPLDTDFDLAPADLNDDMNVPLDVQKLIQQASDGNIDIQELQAQLKYAEAGLAAKKMQNFTPYLNLGWSISGAHVMSPWDFSVNGKKAGWTKGGQFSITLGWTDLMGYFPFS